jgi:pyruvate/2-oxoglutarate dehydrogenase complex dihydrolipoamide acyltransferase (E2) component
VATDKTEVEIEATTSGVLSHAASPEREYPVGAVLGTID